VCNILVNTVAAVTQRGQVLTVDVMKTLRVTSLLGTALNVILHPAGHNTAL